MRHAFIERANPSWGIGVARVVVGAVFVVCFAVSCNLESVNLRCYATGLEAIQRWEQKKIGARDKERMRQQKIIIFLRACRFANFCNQNFSKNQNFLC